MGVFFRVGAVGELPQLSVVKNFQGSFGYAFWGIFKKFLTSGERCGKMSVKWQKESF